MNPSAEDRFEIQDVIARYNQAADAKDVEAMIVHYTDDGVIDGDMTTGRGKAGLRADLPRIFEMEGTLKRHLATNIRFDPSDFAERVTVHYLLVVVEGESLPGVGATARVTDEFRLEGGQWRVARHHLKVDPAMFNAMQLGHATGSWPAQEPARSPSSTDAASA